MPRIVSCLILVIVSQHLCSTFANGDVLSREGLLISSQVQSIVSPVSSTVRTIVPAGTEVRQGDLLLAVDDTALNAQLEKQQQAAKAAAQATNQAELELDSILTEQGLDIQIADRTIRLSELSKERALGPNGEHQQTIRDTESALEQAELAVELADVKLKRITAESEQESEAKLEAQLASVVARNELRLTQQRLDSLRQLDREHLEATLDLAILKSKIERVKIARQHLTVKQQAEKTLASRKRALDSVTQRLQQLEEFVAQCQIFAPFDGVVHGLGDDGAVLAVGAQVRSGRPVLNLVRTDAIEMEVRIDETDLSRVGVGQAAAIRIPNTGTEGIRGRVDRIYRTPSTNFAPAEYVVRISIDENQPGLRVGMKANVDIETGN